MRLTWWDLATKQLHTADLPARTIQVAANPALTIAPVTPAPRVGWRDAPWWWLGGAVALGVLILVGGRSAGLGRVGRRFLAPLRPVHLAPLNPIATRPVRD